VGVGGNREWGINKMKIKSSKRVQKELKKSLNLARFFKKGKVVKMVILSGCKLYLLNSPSRW
jgi:hypothetical protein